MSHQLRFGLVGAGGIAQSYRQAFEGFADARVEAVADPRGAAASAMASDLGCAVYRDHQALAAKADVDAVLVCTPPSSHMEIARHFVDRGIPVLCEKPFAIDPDEAQSLIGAARRAGVLVTMASKFRYVDDVIRAKRILDSGILGETILFENVFASRVAMADRWNSDPAVSGGGVLIDNGTHSVDIARYFLGPIAEVSAVESRRVQRLPVEDTAQLFLRTAAGVTGSIDLSWSVDKEHDCYIGIYGSEGTVEVGWKTSRYRQASSPEWVEFGGGYRKVDAMRAQLANFVRAVRGEEPLLITADDAIASVSVVAAAYRSLGHDRWVAVEASLSASLPMREADVA